MILYTGYNGMWHIIENNGDDNILKTDFGILWDNKAPVTVFVCAVVVGFFRSFATSFLIRLMFQVKVIWGSDKKRHMYKKNEYLRYP